jgi:hypothetical protein
MRPEEGESMAVEFGRTAIFGVAVGIGVGVGLAVLAPSVFPQAARAARPYAKKAVKSGLEAYMRTREGLAEFGEFAEDVVAEARHEMSQARADATAGPSDRSTASAGTAEAKTEAEV